jgi:hypothetical protein
MKKSYLLVLLFQLNAFLTINAQTINVPFTLDKWDTLGVKDFGTETYLGKESILLKSGYISVKGVDLRDGTIEADISFPQQRGFPGFVFRVKDDDNFENFYVRPHQSGNPDATQYTPVFNGVAAWQLYHGEGYSKAFTYRFNEWHHVKIDLHGIQAEIYIDDMQTPLIKVAGLLMGWNGGTFGLTSNGIPLRIANVMYTVKEGTSPAQISIPVTGTNGVITQWNISNVISKNLFENNLEITPALKKQLTWTIHQSEPSGTINLARFGKLSEEGNTMIAKITIESEIEQRKLISFGFSDFVTVYLNNKALFAGRDNFISRDYRFLGTIGYFDTLVLPLKKGANELWFVVSENFGGWGVKAKFENMEKIVLR